MSAAGGRLGDAMSARSLRNARSRRLIRAAAVWVGIPTLIAIAYYRFIASAQYESVAVFMVRSSDDKPAISLDGLAAILPSSGNSSDSAIVKDYIRSRAMMDALEKDSPFPKHYQSASIDWKSRLAPHAGHNARFSYYSKKVLIGRSGASKALTLRVRAFSGEAAQEIANRIMALAEIQVNEISDRERKDRIRFEEQELSRTEKRLKEARQRIVDLQGAGADINPKASAQATLQLRAELEGQLAKAQADLDAVTAVLQPGAPKVRQLRQRVWSIKRQIKKQSKKLVNPDQPDKADADGLNNTIAEFEPAVMEKEFAQKAYVTALRSLELARVEASRQHQYIVMIAPASLPDTPSLPHRWWRIATVFFISFALMGVMLLLGATVREHGKF